MELPFNKKQRVYIAFAGISIFAITLLMQLGIPKTEAGDHYVALQEDNTFTKIILYGKKREMRMPIPSGNPTPLPTFTPTPTSTPTPTPTPTNTPTPTMTPTPTIYIPPPAPGEIDGYFKKYAGEYSVDENLMRKIAACESGYNTTSHNTTYDYAGMYQFSRDTWISTRGQMSDDPNPDLRFNAEQAIKTAAFKISRGGQNAWRNCL